MTMRQIAERLLPDAAGNTFLAREIVSQSLKPLRAPNAHYHVYCSSHNHGAIQLAMEVSGERGFTLQSKGQETARTVNALYTTTEVSNLAECDHMLLYLTSRTWTQGETSAALSEELQKALDLGVHILLVHEMPGVGGQEARFACEFGQFFSDPNGATPHALLEQGIYSEIAVPMKGGAWREVSMALMHMALCMSKEDAETAQEGGDVLDLAHSTQERVARVLKSAKMDTLAKSSSKQMGFFARQAGRKRATIALRKPASVSSYKTSTEAQSTAVSVIASSQSANADLMI